MKGFVVEVPESVVSKVITLDIPITNERFETLIEVEGVVVVVNFKWDSHGDVVPFPSGPNRTYELRKENATVKIIQKDYTQMEREWQTWLLSINGERISGDVYEYNYNSKKNYIVIDIVTGWG